MKKKQTKIIYIIIAIIAAIAIALTVYFVMKNKNSASSDNFTCPTTEYIDCMPRVGVSAKDKAAAEKQARYCDFVAQNCPNVIIAE